MFKTGCIHPDILRVLSRCGHGDKVLIADGNYPLASKSGDAEKVFLGLTAGVPNVLQVLEAIASVVNIEKSEVMRPDDGSIPAIYSDFAALLPNVESQEHGRWDFYEICCKQDVQLAVSTGEQRIYANILLTIGVA